MCVWQTDRQTDGGTDGQTERITTPKTALAYVRAVKIKKWRVWPVWRRTLSNSSSLEQLALKGLTAVFTVRQSVTGSLPVGWAERLALNITALQSCCCWWFWELWRHSTPGLVCSDRHGYIDNDYNVAVRIGPAHDVNTQPGKHLSIDHAAPRYRQTRNRNWKQPYPSVGWSCHVIDHVTNH